MKRVVLDTNVLVCAVLGGRLAPVLDHWSAGRGTDEKARGNPGETASQTGRSDQDGKEVAPGIMIMEGADGVVLPSVPVRSPCHPPRRSAAQPPHPELPSGW